MLEKVVDNVYYWKALQIKLKRHLNGYVFNTADGVVLVDPPAIPDVALPEVETLGRPIAILVTGRHQERRAQQYQRWYDAKLCVPEGDRKLMLTPADVYYNDGDELPGGFTVISLSDQRTAGESAFFHKATNTLVAGHLVGDPPGYVMMQSDSLYHNFSKAFQGQLKLLQHEFDALCPGRGTPLKKDARMCLARYLASYAA